MYTKKKIENRGVTFIKHSRGGLYLWSQLFQMSEQAIKEAIKSHTQTEIDFEFVASWNNLNNASMTFDYPKKDSLRALLGALSAGVITVEYRKNKG